MSEKQLYIVHAVRPRWPDDGRRRLRKRTAAVMYAVATSEAEAIAACKADPGRYEPGACEWIATPCAYTTVRIGLVMYTEAELIALRNPEKKD